MRWVSFLNQIGQAQKNTPYGVGVHVEDRHSGGGRGRKTGIARNLGVAGCPFLMVKMPVNQTLKGAPYGVGVLVENRHSGGGCDWTKGGEIIREARSAL